MRKRGTLKRKNKQVRHKNENKCKEMQRDVGRNIETKQGTAIKAFWEEKQGGDKKREVGIQTSAKE